MRILLPLLLLAAPSFAGCQNESQVFSCTINGKALDICHWKGALIYKFGPEGNPDLTIAEPLETVQFTPWPGIGSSFWETVAFTNAGHRYEVWTSIARDPDSTEGRTGGVRVTKGETPIADLTCDPDTASNALDGIFDLKQFIGQCWDFDSKSWQTTCDS